MIYLNWNENYDTQSYGFECFLADWYSRLGFPHHESFFLLTIYYNPCLIDVWQDLFNYTDIYTLFVVCKGQLNLHWNSFLPTPRFCISLNFWKHSLYAPSTNFNMRTTSFEKLYYVWCSDQFNLKTNEIFNDKQIQYLRPRNIYYKVFRASKSVLGTY